METWKEWEGRVVDQKYPLRQYLGGTADCAVFLTDFGEQKATIKLCSTDPDDAQRQLSLWEQTAALSHPHLIRRLQAGRSRLNNAELLYVVTEYAEETLSQVLPERSLTAAEAHEVILNIVDVLEYLHGNGLVHGRIKPANIMAVENQLKVTSDRLSRVGEFSANPGKLTVYDAPESVRTGLSPAADVWSLGITLVESLTQHPPVGTNTEADLVVPEVVPAPFFDIASHCLLRDPRHRYTVAEIKERLQPASAARAKPVTSAQEIAADKTRRWNYLLPIAVALLVVTILAVPKIRSLHPETAPSPSPAAAPSTSGVPTQSPPSVPTRSPSTVPTQSPSVVPAQPLSKPSAGKSAAGSVVVHQVIPEVPQSARDTIRGTVRVVIRVTVDPTGSVVGMKFDSPGPSRYFSQLASQAASQWKFRSPSVDGQNVSGEWILRFNFERTATTVVPVEVSP